MTHKTLVPLCCACLLVFAFANHASAELQGARVGISTISPCPSFCGGPGSASDFAFAGGPGVTAASTGLSNNDGNGAGSASLTGPLQLPVVGSEAFSNTNSRVGADATALNSYDYVGGTSTTISLDYIFDGIASAPVVNDASAVGSIVVMKGTDFPFSSDYGTLVFEELVFNPNASLVGSDQLSLIVNGGQQSLNGNISIDLDPGDRIAVWAQVATSGTRGGSADALSTLTSMFSNTTGLRPVPSPSSIALAWVAFVSLGCCRSGRRNS